MAESDLFVGEVSDELRRDNFFKVVKKFRWVFVALAACIIGFVAYSDWAKKQAFAKGVAQTEAIELAIKGDAGAKDALMALKSKSALSELMLGKINETSGDKDAALKNYQSVANNVNYTKTEQALAKLRIYALDPKSVAAELFNPNSPFLTEAQLIKTDHLIAAGDKAGAIAIVTELMKAGVSEQMTPMLETLLLAWGAPIPERTEPVEALEPTTTPEVKTNAQ